MNHVGFCSSPPDLSIYGGGLPRFNRIKEIEAEKVWTVRCVNADPDPFR
jgi:hypothetical protein